MAKQFTLGKEERLKSRKQTEQLFSEGKKFTLAPFRICYLLDKNEKASLYPAAIRFGVGVSSKYFKKAVDRNRIKRLVREAYRLQKITLQDKIRESNGQLAVFFIYTDKNLPAFAVIKDRMQIILQKLITLVHEMDSPRS